MNRCLAFVLALCLAFITVSSACIAAPVDWVRFTLEPARGSGDVRATFRDESREKHNNWSSSFPTSQLVGLDAAGFHGAGTRPLRFALVREAGRLDCAGQGGGSNASGNCRFSADPAFTQLLTSRGIGRPSRDQAFGLMALNVRRALIDDLAAAHYPTPSIDDLMGMTALGVDGRYIQDLALAGYRPHSIHSLIEFKALGISPEWISGFARIGYANVPADELVQMKALGITPEFIAGFDRIGYRHLPVDTLVQLKALSITPDFARWAAGQHNTNLPINELVEMKVLGRRR